MRSKRVYALYLLGLAVLWFFVGTMVVEFRIFPYDQFLKPAFNEWRALLQRREAPRSLAASNLWGRVQERPAGVTAHEPKLSSEGLTFFTSAVPSGAVLVEPSGEVAHVWRRRFSEVWPSPAHIEDPASDEAIVWRRARLLGDGSMVVIFAAEGVTPYGYGLAKLDKNSQVLWKAPLRAHHDLRVRGDGTIYALTHRFRNTERRPVSGARFYPEQVLEDFIVELSPTGEVRREISILDAIAESPFRGMLRPTAPTGTCCTRTPSRSYPSLSRPITASPSRGRCWSPSGTSTCLG